MREAALKRLDAFLPRAGRAYAASRNTDAGDAGRQGVSLISPYLRHRLISEEEVVRRVLAVHSYSAAEKYIQEVAWRTYWKGWLEMRPAIWEAYVQSLPGLWAEHGGKPYLERALEGRTGIDCFDAWVAELKRTGFLHNHTRMWFASIWIFTLGLPWQLGAALFYEHLLDGDAASNTLSWRWVAGLHTKGKHYLARAENIRRYTNGRFHPVGALNEGAKPLPMDIEFPKPAVPEAMLTPEDVAGELAEGTLVLTADDASLETCLRNPPRRLVVCYPPAVELGHALSEKVMVFKKAVLVDAVARFGVPADRVWWVRGGVFPVDLEGEQSVFMAKPAVGPLRDWVDQQRFPVRYFRRGWDTVLYPLATKGFFPFKKALPDLCQRLQASGVSPGSADG